MAEPYYLTTPEAAAYLGVSRSWLEKQRRSGGGPTYRKHGALTRYDPADLRKWSDEHTRTSTSKATSKARNESEAA